jgi:hypothetical protein
MGVSLCNPSELVIAREVSFGTSTNETDVARGH